MTNIEDNIDLQLKECISKDKRKSFFLFAGAGSGKTYSLVKLLKEIKDSWENVMLRDHRQVAVITYTNAATNEILNRIDYCPLFHVSTIHSFIWDTIKIYQKDIKKLYIQRLQGHIDELKAKMDATKNKKNKTYLSNKEKLNCYIKREDDITKIKKFIYNPNGDNLKTESLNHADVIEIGIKMMTDNVMLQKIITQQYPFMLIDESQDTKSGLVDALFTIQRKFSNEFTLGFIGDIKQRIYMDGKAEIKGLIPDDWAKPEKTRNYRCAKRIIEVTNKISSYIDGSTQQPRDDAPNGFVHLFLAKNKEGLCKKNIEFDVREKMAELTNDDKWNSDVKVLAIEHRMAAVRLGFQDFYDLFSKIPKYQMSFLQGEIAEMSLFSQNLFPLISMIKDENEVGVLNILKKASPLLEAVKDINYPNRLKEIKVILKELNSINFNEKKVADIIAYIQNNSLFIIPENLRLALNTKEHDVDDENLELKAWTKAIQLPLSQFCAYDDYVHDRTSYATHQGVKGLEFPRVMVLIDDNESKGKLFSYDKLFEVAPLSATDVKNRKEGKENSMNRTARLFYVTCTRAKDSLAILMYTNNPEKAKQTAIKNKWFNENEIDILG